MFKNVLNIILNIDLEHVKSGWKCLLLGSIIAELEYYSGNLLEKLLHSALLNNLRLPWNFMKKDFTVGVLFGKNWIFYNSYFFELPHTGAYETNFCEAKSILLRWVTKFICFKDALHKICEKTGFHWPVFSRTRQNRFRFRPYTGEYEIVKTRILAYFMQ